MTSYDRQAALQWAATTTQWAATTTLQWAATTTLQWAATTTMEIAPCILGSLHLGIGGRLVVITNWIGGRLVIITNVNVYLGDCTYG